MVTDDLDRRSKRVLEAIYQYGGEAEMSEIKEYTGIEKNGIVLYRLNEKLGPAGLVETRKLDGEEGNLGVTVAALTESGKTAVGRVLDDGESGPTLAEQVQMLRTEVEDLTETVEMYDGRADRVEERLDDVIDRFEELTDVAEVTQRAEAVIERHDDVAEENRELRERIEGSRDVGEELTNAGLLDEAATGSGYVSGSALSQIRVLAEAGVFGRLVESENLSKYLGTEEDQQPEEIDGLRVPDVPEERGRR